MPTGRDLARKVIDKLPTASDRALGRILYKENKLQFASEKSAYAAVLAVRGSAGKRDRTKGSATHKREAPFALSCPPSRAKSWEPYVIQGPCKALVLSDLHVPYHDRAAIEEAVSHARENFDIDVLLLNGDAADFFSISRWEKNPRERDLVAELGVVEELLGWLKSKFPNAKRVYKLGNHEERWHHYLWAKAPELVGIANISFEEIIHLDTYGFALVDEQRIAMVGKLPIYHGHELPKGIASPVNPARGLYMRTAHSGLMGHCHRASSHSESNVFHASTVCWSTGCLCDRSPEYARINKWDLGFAVVEVDKKGDYLVHNFRISSEGKARNV